MPIGICGKCHKPMPDGFHDFKEICACKTKEQWISMAKRMKWFIIIDGKKHDFTEE